MVGIILVVREFGRLKPDYSLSFEVPAIPRAGDYLSIQRPDEPEPYGEDMIVRQVWWRLRHPETSGFAVDGEEKVGDSHEVIVECEPATGPYSSDKWLKSLGSEAGVEEFKVARVSVPQRVVTNE